MKLNLATILTLFRIAAIPIVVVMFYAPFENARPIAAVLFGIAAVTDFIDGWIARRTGTVTAIGKPGTQAFLGADAPAGATNIKVGNLLEDCHLFWYEEPVLADNINECAEVARAITAPVATGENEYTRYGFRDLIAAEAAQYLNPDIHRVGGFSEMMKISHLAAAFNVKIAPHLVPELSMHVMAAIPNGSLVEVLAGCPADLFTHPVEIVDGAIALPDRPGHGVEFSREAIERYTI